MSEWNLTIAFAVSEGVGIKASGEAKTVTCSHFTPPKIVIHLGEVEHRLHEASAGRWGLGTGSSEYNPGARFIYLMRDPNERTISHYWHMVRYHAERRPMLEAIKTDPQHLDVSHHAMQADAISWTSSARITLPY